MTLLNDPTIRSAFKANFEKTMFSKLVDECDLSRGDARIDLLHFGEFITGFEIKSDKDTLNRLLGQAEFYNRSLEKIVLITGKKYKDKVLDQIPIWWGLVVAREEKGIVTFNSIREPYTNPYFDPTSLLDLLWKNELIEMLADYGIKGTSSKTKYELKSIAKGIVNYRELKNYVLKFISFRDENKFAG